MKNDKNFYSYTDLSQVVYEPNPEHINEGDIVTAEFDAPGMPIYQVTGKVYCHVLSNYSRERESFMIGDKRLKESRKIICYEPKFETPRWNGSHIVRDDSKSVWCWDVISEEYFELLDPDGTLPALELDQHYGPIEVIVNRVGLVVSDSDYRKK